MKSLIVLMIEEEQPEGISSRKLVVETAKHNVITAYDADTGLNLLQRFPKVDAVLVHSSLLEKHGNLLREIRNFDPDLPIILAHPFRDAPNRESNHNVDSHNPQQLLKILNEQIPQRWAE